MPAQKGSCSHQLHPRTHNQMGLLKISSNQYVKWFTRRYQKKNPKEELYTFLHQYRATPHSTTEKSPAEMLFGRRIKTKLPWIHTTEETAEQKRTRVLHDKKKLLQKKYFDRKHRAKPKVLHPGDQVLLKQTKTTTKPPFNPAPFIVTEVEGNQVTITDGDIVKKRDKNKLKVLPKRKALGHQSDKVVRCEKVRHNQDIEIDMQKLCDSIRDHEPVQEPEQQVQEPGLVEVAEHQPHEEEIQPLYRPSEDMNNHLQALLMSAAARSAEEPNPSPSSTPSPFPSPSPVANSRTTRSAGVALEWNPSMGARDPVVRADMENE